MLTYKWGLSYMSPQKGGLSHISQPKKRGGVFPSKPATRLNRLQQRAITLKFEANDDYNLSVWVFVCL